MCRTDEGAMAIPLICGLRTPTPLGYGSSRFGLFTVNFVRFLQGFSFL